MEKACLECFLCIQWSLFLCCYPFHIQYMCRYLSWKKPSVKKIITQRTGILQYFGIQSLPDHYWYFILLQCNDIVHFHDTKVRAGIGRVLGKRVKEWKRQWRKGYVIRCCLRFISLTRNTLHCTFNVLLLPLCNPCFPVHQQYLPSTYRPRYALSLFSVNSQCTLDIKLFSPLCRS